MILTLENVLRRHWALLWDRLLSGQMDEEFVYTEWERRVKRYDHPARAYHNLEHILCLVKTLTPHLKSVENPDALLIAVFDHDWFYFTEARPKGLPSNEVLSAAASDETLMRARNLVGSRVTMEFRDAVMGHIMVTHHNERIWKPRNRDEMLIADADFSPMGWAWDDFVENGKKIRQEYSFELTGYTDEQFIVGRLNFLESLREKEFYLPEFQEKYGDQMRANIVQGIDMLQQGHMV